MIVKYVVNKVAERISINTLHKCYNFIKIFCFKHLFITNTFEGTTLLAVTSSITKITLSCISTP